VELRLGVKKKKFGKNGKQKKSRQYKGEMKKANRMGDTHDLAKDREKCAFSLKSKIPEKCSQRPAQSHGKDSLSFPEAQRGNAQRKERRKSLRRRGGVPGEGEKEILALIEGLKGFRTRAQKII